ncbi:MAG: alcohol dehydrogenase catalytic domain-containing protein [Chloroflexi bacterium]|nr:alcohol dehydrogenase catalytic domain-containing protein [Chloroflexota bacterium]MCI0578208.1 alcohol dehydrogenase catalytic domain-containing protein [Chloroflexota bacterium]MCI0645299.1 alcohol dehydrogenase catalytic domain-containing protein [Chloroflexota bacterium]MCI0729547.1 alcohol dehydrogenase catalytic domain-containing protein [Chloroflexota bacterium]
MKAVFINAPHQAALRDIAQPAAGPGQVLVRVAAAGMCMSDLEILKGIRPEPYIKYPIIPGHEWCGTVVETGPGVTRPAVGQRVAIEGLNPCRTCFWCQRGETNLCVTYNEFGFTLPGGYAEYVAVRADLAHPFADTLSFDVAALTEPAACAGHGILRAGMRPGDTIAIVGPGTIGLLGVAWARLFSPRRIIALGIDRMNERLARMMGVTEYLVIDDDPVSCVRELTDGRGADVVFEAAGSETAIQLAFDLARRGGTVALAGIVGGQRQIPLESDIFCLKNLHVHGVFSYTSSLFAQSLRLIENGLLDVRPLLTHTFPLAEYSYAFDLLRSRREPVGKILLKP